MNAGEFDVTVEATDGFGWRHSGRSALERQMGHVQRETVRARAREG